MKIINADNNFRISDTIITLGKFDGNHIGHRALFDAAGQIKKDSDIPLSTVIFTFDVNPRRVIDNSHVPNIYTNAERIELEEAFDIDCVYIWPFTRENMSMEPVPFAEEVLKRQLGVKHIVIGEDFRFGRDRKGDAALLESLQTPLGFRLHTVPKVKFRGQDVSSTRIKEEILKGNLEDANFMLGCPFSVTGKVIPGKHLGKSLGFPTINFEAESGKVLPPDGVYATMTHIDGKKYMSMTNIGSRPTFESGQARNIETNIFDFDRNIYGRYVKLEFHEFIRPEKRFDSAEGLVKELEKNKAQIKEILTGLTHQKAKFI